MLSKQAMITSENDGSLDIKSEKNVIIVDIVSEMSDVSETILLIESVVKKFHDGLILYHSGSIYVFLNTSCHFQNRIRTTKFDKQKNDLIDVCSKYNEFLVYPGNSGQMHILPPDQNFKFAFDYIRKLQLKSFVVKTFFNILGSNTRGKTNKAKVISVFKTKKNTCLGKKKVKTSINILNGDYFPSFTARFNLPVLQPSDDAIEQHTPASNREEQDTFNSSLVPSGRATSMVSHDGYSIDTNLVVTSASSFIHDRLDQHASYDSVTPSIPPRYPEYADRSARQMSFVGWGLRSPNPQELYIAGFFYKNQGDLVRCFQCGIGLKDFSEGDDPLLEHVKHSGECPYLHKLLGDNQLDALKAQLRSSDPEYNRQQQWNGRNGSFPSAGYRHPQFITFESRLATYQGWPPAATQTPSQLAEAGLYYTGTEDLVRCFACDGGLRRWDAEDDPWTEHCRWFPTCPYCIEQKGEEYIALIQASVDQEELGASGGGLVNNMEQLRLAETEVNALYNANKEIFIDMGFIEAEVKQAIQELRNRGISRPELEDIVDLIAVIKERNEAAENARQIIQDHDMVAENRRLKQMVYCMFCQKNTVNALFLPCTHLELCMDCSESLDVCPLCHRNIREKIRTFLG